MGDSHGRSLSPTKSADYLTRAIDVMDKSIRCFRFFRRLEEESSYNLLQGWQQDLGSDVINTLKIYGRVLKSLRTVLEEKGESTRLMSMPEAEKFILDKFNRYKEVLTCIKDGKEVSDEEKREVINLFQEMRKDTLSETEDLLHVGCI